LNRLLFPEDQLQSDHKVQQCLVHTPIYFVPERARHEFRKHTDAAMQWRIIERLKFIQLLEFSDCIRYAFMSVCKIHGQEGGAGTGRRNETPSLRPKIQEDGNLLAVDEGSQ